MVGRGRKGWDWSDEFYVCSRFPCYNQTVIISHVVTSPPTQMISLIVINI